MQTQQQQETHFASDVMFWVQWVFERKCSELASGQAVWQKLTRALAYEQGSSGQQPGSPGKNKIKVK